jgi:cytoskeletal protein CcmA (bactofilin family)
MKRTPFLIGAFLIISIPLSVLAAPVIRSGEAVTVGQDQMVAGDLYAVGGSVALSGAVQGDVYIGSGVATLNAPISADATVVSGTVQVHAPIGDDLRAAAGEVTLADAVSGDVVVMGGSLHVLSTASIEGDIIFFGGELTVEGPVEGSIFGSADAVRIDAAIGGNVEVTAYNELTLGDRANVEGAITYKSRHDLVRSQNSVVIGEIQKESLVLKDAVSPEQFLVPFLMLLFAALALFLVAKRHLPPLVALTTKRYGLNGILGLAILGGMPFVATILMVSVLGFFAGLFLLLVYAALVLFSFIFGTIVIGVWAMKLLLKRGDISISAVVAGVILMQIALLIPYVGFLAALAIVAIVLGSLATALYRRIF